MKVEIPAFEQASVLVVGDIMLDRYWYGPTQRISPEAPVPVVKINQDEHRPGGAANVALNIASIGGRVTLIGITGKDEAAQHLQKKLSALNIHCEFDQQANIPTITKLRVMSRNQQLIRLDFEESLSDVDKTLLEEKVATQLVNHDLLLLSDYSKGTLSEVQNLIAIAKKQGKAVLVDPKGTDFERYRGATLLTPNLSEFEAVVGECKTENDIVSKGQALLVQLDLDAMLVTRSEQGMTLLRRDHDEFHLPTRAREVYDVTGAGDTVIATLALAIAAKAEYTQASALANIAAGIVVGKLGTSTVSEAELLAEISAGQESGFGVVTEEQLKIAVKLAKARGENIVMTNGCFDILHAGHVSYLTHAGTLGTRLIVAVNDDASVKRLKGSGRPVNPTDRRMAVLAGLGAVDWVVSFSEDTPQRIISNILPDILVKGGDYKVEDIAGGKEVMANGGDVKVLNFEEGISTTDIINSIRLK
ncbi:MULTISPECIES: bifunctional D-glycero-beta-D-manno-heptose-7-phosphate kinase/D-glycero-beta-D-manno-heptose 1-phosphate adenylyltransferase HldE [unclassified Colwellia]|uniref:bifunctional D-glycero-beta-D-manno-heptose-7-phosphate kinase/D-glycero-beta-D-manno-heptose 1-phosphate adenylyltransferase HldE n=1 Tax=unclassified Colwellia TaxID=196834 RepID=UPI0015F69BCE|nr:MULTISPECIES: bifunctional D-glycero-beta-D-manno-heptose-7-phosphate kinase/D-glycero-beta-D-manno-heptose 1-phosphate adenylyltransferase HldE [unclassified Colwellia]MBA6230724.1 bifunctional D-glycero-beta-D-manno-heptose-7-phosphate kinase/D-glycero-beta-D-manno-heptose 1-phosphate adenylyltransferase HldE [Colwellia sp. MB02u-7]MBA6234655.1 bifunctional D-glycero-beta-D-manno-heptose-7-phosphate kinase/D-glycero-beta-D-manno-heptose 1-phosphate adenylyltransferase HldE [Colwellia sp. MB0